MMNAKEIIEILNEWSGRWYVNFFNDEKDDLVKRILAKSREEARIRIDMAYAVNMAKALWDIEQYLKAVIWDIEQYRRDADKYDKPDTIEGIRKEFYDILEANNINLDSLK